MNEMIQWQAVSLLVKMLEAVRGCPWTRTLRPLCYQNIRPHFRLRQISLSKTVFGHGLGVKTNPWPLLRGSL